MEANFDVETSVSQQALVLLGTAQPSIYAAIASLNSLFNAKAAKERELDKTCEDGLGKALDISKNEAAQKLLKAFPFLPHHSNVAAQAVSVPHPSPAFRIHSSTGKVADVASSIMSETGRKHGHSSLPFKEKAVANWRDIHNIVCHSECEACPKPPRADCAQLGFCICSGPGLVLKALRTKFHTEIKKHMKAVEPLISNGYTVARIFRSADADEDATDGEWVHIAQVYKKPWELSLTKMSCRGTNADGEIVLQASLRI